MSHNYKVEDFISNGIHEGTITVEQRDKMWRLAESGASATTLLTYLRKLGYKSGLQTVINWKDARVSMGEKAQEINAWTRQARGLMPSDALNQLAYWMLNIIQDCYKELGRRELSEVKTNQLLLIVATYASKAQEAVVQAEKVRSLADCKDFINATIEEARMTGRQILQTESPEMIAVIDRVLDTVIEKLDV